MLGLYTPSVYCIYYDLVPTQRHGKDYITSGESVWCCYLRFNRP